MKKSERPSKIIFNVYLSVFVIVGLILSFYADSAGISLYFDLSRSDFVNLVLSFFNLLGEPIAHLLAIFIIGYYNVKNGLIFGALVGLNLIVIVGLKLYFAKPRPLTFFNDNGMLEILNISDHTRILTEDTSFPSYHAAGAFVLCVFLLLNLKNVYLTLILFTSAILTAIARVYFFHHFFIDTYFGAVIGISLTILVMFLFSKYGSKLEKWNSSFADLRKIRKGD